MVVVVPLAGGMGPDPASVAASACLGFACRQAHSPDAQYPAHRWQPGVPLRLPSPPVIPPPSPTAVPCLPCLQHHGRCLLRVQLQPRSAAAAPGGAGGCHAGQSVQVGGRRMQSRGWGRPAWFCAALCPLEALAQSMGWMHGLWCIADPATASSLLAVPCRDQPVLCESFWAGDRLTGGARAGRHSSSRWAGHLAAHCCRLARLPPCRFTPPALGCPSYPS